MRKERKTKSVHLFFDKKLRDAEFQRLYEEVSPLMKIAIEVSEARNKAGLSQGELAERLKTSQSVISRIENGNQNMSVGMLVKIANALGCSFCVRMKPEYEKDEMLNWDINKENQYRSLSSGVIVIDCSENSNSEPVFLEA